MHPPHGRPGTPVTSSPDPVRQAADRAVVAAASAAVALLMVAVLLRSVGLPWLVSVAAVAVAAVVAGWSLWWFPQVVAAASAGAVGTGIADGRRVAGGLVTRLEVRPTGTSGTGVGHLVAFCPPAGAVPRGVPVRVLGCRGRIVLVAGQAVWLPVLPVRTVGRRALGVGQTPSTPR